MKNENENKDEDNEIVTAGVDGGVMTLSAKGMTYKNEDNEIETVDYAWKMNRKGLYRALSSQINEKLNVAVQGLEFDSFAEPVVLYFSCHTLARHFAEQLKTHGWIATIDDDDVVQVDVVASIDKMSKDNQDDDDDIGDDGFFDDSVLSLK